MDPTQMPLGSGMANQASQQLQQRPNMIALQEAAANGDPKAQQILMQMQQQQQGGGAPQGGMSQSQFGNGGQPVPPDVQARRAKQLIELLRARGG
jgi:hypothetical protein